LIHILGIDIGGIRKNECVIDNKLASFHCKQAVPMPNNSKHDIPNPDEKELSMEFADNHVIFGDGLKDAEHCYPNDSSSERLDPNVRIKDCVPSDNTVLDDIKNTQQAEQLKEVNLHVLNVTSMPNTNTKGNDDPDSSRLQEYRNTNVLESFALSSNENPYLQTTSLINLGQDNTPDIIMDTKEKEHFKINENITKAGYYKHEVYKSANERKISPGMSSLQTATSSAAEFITISEWNEEEEEGIPLKYSAKYSKLLPRNIANVCEENATTITRAKLERTEKLDGNASTTVKENKLLTYEKEDQDNNQKEKNINCSEKSLPPEYTTGSTSSQGKYGIEDYVKFI